MDTRKIKEAVDNIGDILTQIDSLNEAKKEALDAYKEAGLPHKAIAKAAQLLVKQKHQSYREETQEVNDILDITV